MRRVALVAAWSAAGVLLLALLLIGAVIIFGNVSAGRSVLERETARLTSGRVRIEGLGGTFPWALDIASLQLSDPRGVWMTARGVSVRWSPLALLAWKLHVERFEVASATVARRPVSAASSSSNGSHLPAIDIDRLGIKTLALEPAAAGAKTILTVRGTLHYASMKNVRVSLAAMRTNGRGEYELELHRIKSRLTAGLELKEPAGGPLEHLVNLPGLGALSVVGHLAGPSNAEKLRLRAQVGALRASADGTLDLERRAADLTYSLTSPAMTPRPGLSWRRVALQGSWRGPLAAPHASATAQLSGLELADGAQLETLAATLRADGRLLSVRAQADGIRLAGSPAQLLAGSPLDLQTVWHLAAPGRPMQLTVTHRLLDLKAQIITAGARGATFTLELPHLAPLAALYREQINGRLTLKGAVAERGSSTRLDVTGAGNLQGASVAAQLLGHDAHLHLVATLTPATADIDRLDLTGQGLSLFAAGSAGRSRSGASSSAVRAVKLHWRASLPNLALVSSALGGSLETRGTVTGPLRSPRADVQMQSRLSIRGSPPGNVRATLRVSGLPSAPSVALQANGELDGAPLRLDGSLARTAARTFHLVVRRAEWKSLAVKGNLTSGPNLAGGHGRLSLRIDRLADLQPFVASALEGSIQGSIALVPVAGRASARVELSARNVEAAGVSGNARLTASGPIDALRIQLSAQSPGFHGAPVSLAADARLNERSRVLALDRFEASYHGQTVRLLSPSSIRFARGLEVRHLRLGAQQAVVALDGELSPVLNLRASIRDVDAALVDAFVPKLLAQGTFSAEARLSGSRAAPVGTASLRIADLKLANAAAGELPAVNIRGSARFRRTVADVSTELDAGSASRIRLSGRAPLNATGAVALKLAGTIDARLMNSILEARGERAAGTLTVDATVTGSAHAPQIGGSVRLVSGDLRDYAEGIHLEDIDALLVARQDVLKIASMTARAGPGRLSASGTIGILQPQMPIDVTVSARNIQPITSDLLTANLNTRMRVTGTLRKRIDVTGTIRVNHASISVPNGMPASVETLEVIRPGEAPRPLLPKRRLVIGLGITLDAPESVFLQGRGLNAQLGGKLRVAGTSADPQVSGGFAMIRGTFSLAGTTLNFTRGRVSFNGEGLKGKIDPTLDFVAQTSVAYPSTTTVTLRVTGFADSPKISLSSNPPLPQDDLLALLLFGKPASQLSPWQLAEIGGGLASLAGVGGGSPSWNPLTWIKSGLGLNTLSVGAATPPGGGAAGTRTPGASITAGKYLTNRVYLAATQTTTGESQVQVDISLSRHFKLQTRLGNGTATAQGITPENDPGSSIGFIWQITY